MLISVTSPFSQRARVVIFVIEGLQHGLLCICEAVVEIDEHLVIFIGLGIDESEMAVARHGVGSSQTLHGIFVVERILLIFFSLFYVIARCVFSLIIEFFLISGR